MRMRSVTALFSLISILTFRSVGLAESSRTKPFPKGYLMDGTEEAHVPCLQKLPLGPPSPHLVLVSGHFRWWVDALCSCPVIPSE